MKMNLHQATSDVALGTGIKHLESFDWAFDGCQKIFGLFAIQILLNLDKIFKWKYCII